MVSGVQIRSQKRSTIPAPKIFDVGLFKVLVAVVEPRLQPVLRAARVRHLAQLAERGDLGGVHAAQLPPGITRAEDGRWRAHL